MKKLFFSLLCILAVLEVFSQRGTADVGIYTGLTNPFIDYTKTYRLRSIGIDYGAYIRYNYNTRISMRVNALYGGVRGAGLLDMQQSASFKKNVLDLSAIWEINYTDFSMGAKKHNFTPMVYTGFGISLFSGINNQMVVTPNIPIGVGVKYALSKKWGVTAEYSMHKLFSDQLDNLKDPYSQVGLENVTDLLHNNDWIGYFGISMMYRFFSGRKPCPVYDSMN
jgi:hypothetical protein